MSDLYWIFDNMLSLAMAQPCCDDIAVQYFQFCGWRHVYRLWPGIGDTVRLYTPSDSLGTLPDLGSLTSTVALFRFALRSYIRHFMMSFLIVAVSDMNKWDYCTVIYCLVIWLGKGSEDKRGQAVLCNGPDKSWLYLTPVVCTRQMEVAAMVTAINPAISSTADSLDIAVLQQVLSVVCYDACFVTVIKSFLAIKFITLT